MHQPLRRLARAARRSPLDAALALVVVLTSLYVVAAPFTVVSYPPMTDLPFHAAQTSALRHYADPAFHFREQFTLQPIAVPYLSMYALGALLMLVFSAATAVKIAAALHLALLPLGLALLFHGMKRSPLLGILGLLPVWSNLTHWGFLNFMGALGLFALVLGLTLRLVDRPSRGRQVALGLALVALFFSHIFRFPFAILAVLATAFALYPVTHRLRPVLLPLVPSLALFGAWLIARTEIQRSDPGPLRFHPERLGELVGHVFAASTNAAEHLALRRATRVLVAAAVVTVLVRLVERYRSPARPRPPTAFRIAATLVPLGAALAFLGLFFVLPMQIGLWWYVYPREATAALFLGLTLFPDLPRSPWLRAPIVISLALAALGVGKAMVDEYAEFERTTEDFRAITRKLPAAPKLLYLVFDHRGSARSTTPFVHLPAWVQAERGGWLSFHFAIWNASPLAYRPRDEPGAVVPPPTPPRWEWTPQRFDVRRHGPFFDWFLVRQRRSPDALFSADPTLERVDQVGTFWLYRRRVAPEVDSSLHPAGSEGSPHLD